MITVIICGVLAFIIMLIIMSDYGIDFEAIIMCLLVAFLGVIAGFLIAIILPAKTKIVKTVYKLEKIKDLKSGDEFFASISTISDEVYYVAYYKENNLYKNKTIDFTDTDLEYSDTARLEEYKTVDIKCTRNYFALDIDELKYILYLPKGTINPKYSLKN